MTVVTLGIMFCDTGKVSTKEEHLEWPVTDEERNSDKGWGSLWQGADLSPEDPPDERRTGKGSGGAPLVYLRDSQCP